MTSPNQRTIVSDKTTVIPSTGKERPYLIAYVDIIEESARQLSGNAFKLYIYLLSHNKNWKFGFSPKDVAERYGCSADTIRDSFTILVNKGFLTLASGSKTKYIFTDVAVPQAIALPNEVTSNIEKKLFKDSETNTTYSWTFKELLNACGNDESLAKKLWEETE